MLACKYNNPDVINCLFRHCPESLYQVSQESNEDCVHMLTLVHIVAERADGLGNLKCLLGCCDFDLMARDNTGLNPLMVAFSCGNFESCKYLLEYIGRGPCAEATVYQHLHASSARWISVVQYACGKNGGVNF